MRLVEAGRPFVTGRLVVVRWLVVTGRPVVAGPLVHGGFDCMIRSVPLRWLSIGFHAFDKMFYNRNSITSFERSHGNREDVCSAVSRQHEA